MVRFSKFLDWFSNFFAHRKGLLPILGIVFVILNFFLQLTYSSGWVVQTNLFLHTGIVLAILGMLLAWAL
jgi:hypothetical protein